MEFLRVVRRRSVLSETIYILLNIALAGAILVFTISTGTPWAAIVLVLLSKWRILAVRPRFWFAHLEANMVDIIVSIGVVILMYLAGQSTSSGVLVQVVLAILYAAWLLFLKPRTRRSYVATQAAVALFVGSFALESLSYEWPSSLVVIVLWLIGYACARHVLVSHSDDEIRFLSLLWAFVTAEIGWLSYHWTIAYTLPFGGGLKLPQATLLLLGISFLAERTYSSYMKHQAIRFNDIVLPMLLVVGVIFILMTLFNSASIGSSV
ncbi:MAG: rane protein of unknown function [Candidatus Saccharibacteria bacterium]|nr:rane protein of unknown function [Candidatus Saccharibacteria bacterium]